MVGLTVSRVAGFFARRASHGPGLLALFFAGLALATLLHFISLEIIISEIPSSGGFPTSHNGVIHTWTSIQMSTGIFWISSQALRALNQSTEDLNQLDHDHADQTASGG